MDKSSVWLIARFCQTRQLGWQRIEPNVKIGWRTDASASDCSATPSVYPSTFPAERIDVAAAGVTLVNTFKYRGADEEWSNTYHFHGDAPDNDFDWTNLIVQLATKVGVAMSDLVTCIRGYGYADTDDDAVFTYDLLAHGFEVVGSVDTTGAYIAPGDAAATVRWKTARTNSKGKPIYLRKYYHSVILAGDTADAYDSLQSDYRTAINTMATDLLTPDTDWPGLAGPDGVIPGAVFTSPYATTRTLKRRGPRPS